MDSPETSSFFHHLKPHWFLQPEVMRIYLPTTGTLGSTVQPGAGITLSPGIPPHVFSTTCERGPTCSTSHHRHLTTTTACRLAPAPSPTLLPVWMNIVSLYPWLLDSHTVRVGGCSRCFLFWG